MEIAFIIIPVESGTDKENKLNEILQLTLSAGAKPQGYEFVKINSINPSTYIGSGKAEQLKEKIQELECNLVIFDGELSPSKTLNLSAALGDVKVVDRTTLILDIFALNAKSSEGKLQVKLAQLKYIYPRLKGKGSSLSKLGGGIGTRGPGETQLETDRRNIRRRIVSLEKKLKEIQTRRQLQTENREKNDVLSVALAGYTNTGKSTLLNALTSSDVLTEDKLFATLDTTTRKLNLGNYNVLISDTVGFIKNIPTTLIAAFKSTLEAAINADIILIVCAANGDWQNEISTTDAMLDELNCKGIRLIVINKCDTVNNFELYPKDAIFVSAKNATGLDKLKQRLKDEFASSGQRIKTIYPEI